MFPDDNLKDPRWPQFRCFPIKHELIATTAGNEYVPIESAQLDIVRTLTNPPSSITQGIVNAYCPGLQTSYRFFSALSDYEKVYPNPVRKWSLLDLQTLVRKYDRIFLPELAKIFRTSHYSEGQISRPLAVNNFMDEIGSTVVVSIENASTNKVNDISQTYNTTFVRDRNKGYTKIANEPSIMTDWGSELSFNILLQNIHGDPPFLGTRLAWLNLEVSLLSVGISPISQ
jgi:hypothetical protein